MSSTTITIRQDEADFQPLLQGEIHESRVTTSNTDEQPIREGTRQGWMRWLLGGSSPDSTTTTAAAAFAEPNDNEQSRADLDNASAPPPTQPVLPSPPAPSAARPITPSLSSHSIALPSSSASASSPLLQPALEATPSPSNTSGPLSLVPTPHPASIPNPSSPTASSSSASSQPSLSRTRSSDSGPQCLICLEPLTPEDFERGEAMVLECLCKGDNALRHRSCAEKWTQMRGTRTCELCKTPIGNLPEPPPRPPSPHRQLVVEFSPPLDDFADALIASNEHNSAVADQMFDCIRVMWVTMIIGILWFQMSVGAAFLVGAVMGLLYSAFCVMLQRYCHPGREASLQSHALQNSLV